jgi:hypothetical protein
MIWKELDSRLLKSKSPACVYMDHIAVAVPTFFCTMKCEHV